MLGLQGWFGRGSTRENRWYCTVHGTVHGTGHMAYSTLAVDRLVHFYILWLRAYSNRSTNISAGIDTTPLDLDDIDDIATRMRDTSHTASTEYDAIPVDTRWYTHGDDAWMRFPLHM